MQAALTERYLSCRILEKEGILNVIWFEDAAGVTWKRHGSYTDGPRVNASANEIPVYRGGIRLEKPGGVLDSGTVLINASEWAYKLENHTDCGLAPLPPLHNFLESIMGRWLDISEPERADNMLWEMSLVCLIGYAYEFSGTNYDLVRRPDFTASLAPEFHGLHCDLVGKYPHKAGISSFKKHEYHAMRRQQIREGVFVPQPYPTDCFPGSLAEYPELTGVNVLKRREQKKKRTSTKPRKEPARTPDINPQAKCHEVLSSPYSGEDPRQ